MRLVEFARADASTPKPDELLGLVQFLAGRVDDTNAKKTISKNAFVSLAQSLDINVNLDNVEQIVGQPPLSSVLEPLKPGSDEIFFKGAGQSEPVAMPVNKAQDIVAAAAKSAMNRDRGV